MELFDRVRESTTMTGTGNVTLDGADSGYFAFGTVLEDGDETCIVIAAGAEAEVVIAHYDAGANELLRDGEVLASTNAGALVSFSGGVKKVWIDHPALLDMRATGLSLALSSGIGII